MKTKKKAKKKAVKKKVKKKAKKKVSRKKKVDLVSKVEYQPDDGEETFTIVREEFTAESPKHLGHLKLSDHSGMGSWLNHAADRQRSWSGAPPEQCTVAYDAAGKAIGWCAVGYYDEKYDLIGTYVLPDFRTKGIGVQLVKMTLMHQNRKRGIAFDDAGWDIGPMLKKAKIKHISFFDLW